MDVFAFNGQYGDVATVSQACKFGGGTMYFYQGFNAQREGRWAGVELVVLLKLLVGTIVSTFTLTLSAPVTIVTSYLSYHALSQACERGWRRTWRAT
jgi:hypothetical protein